VPRYSGTLVARSVSQKPGSLAMSNKRLITGQVSLVPERRPESASRLRFPDKPSLEGFRDRRAFTAGCGYALLGPSTLNVARGEPRVIHFIAQEGC
jgi:hypothetical protein